MYHIILLQPATDFVDRLEVKMQAKVLRSIDLLEQFGPQLPMPHSKKLSGHDLYELRVKQSTNIVRMFYFHKKDKIYVVTSGYSKKSEKTNQNEIEKAERIKSEYLEENK